MSFKMTYDKRNRENLDKLADHTRQVAYKFYQYCIDNNINILIYETIRTIEKQKQNVANGKSKTMRSYHLVAQALDFVPIVNGKEGWNLYGKEPFISAIRYAESIGFEWGGRWKNFYDAPHLQFNHKGYGTDTFTNTPVTQPSPQPLPDGITAVVEVIVDDLNIRSGAGTHFDVVRKAKKGERFNVVANVNDWHKVIYADGDFREAWIYGNNGQYLSLLRN